MTLKQFLIGMAASFGLAWFCLIAIPAQKMAALPAVKMSQEEDAPYYERKVAGRIKNGAQIYAANGCYYCHTQLIRPTYLGRQIWREDVAGVISDDGDTRRETSYYDFEGEEFAMVGRKRIGPDLSNFGHRAEKYAALAKMSPEQWVVEHLYNPRNSALFLGEDGQKQDRDWSSCPSQPQMFKRVELLGQGGDLVVQGDADESQQIVAGEQARIFASYLLSLKRDDAMPEKLDFAPKKNQEAK